MKHDFPIPEAALLDHIADVGKTGSGKTSTAKLIIEHVATAGGGEGNRVCILDPVKSDWWGITSSADGKKPGLPFTILGGPRGHVPLNSHSGAAIAELVATGALPLSILDMADFEAGGLQRFFTEFAPVLLRKMRGVLYLVLEEAHEFAPKERSGIGNENLAVHWAKKLATAGRSRGLRMIVCTQRTQALHNALLGSCETMIAHRLTAPADQKPVVDWFKGNASKDSARQVEASLASLKTGTAWVYSGQAQLFERIAFPRIKTFDNSATPTGDDAVAHIKTAPVDLEHLRGVIGSALVEAEANDPKLLRAKVAKLEGEMAALTALGADLKAVVTAPDPQAEQRGYGRGKIEGYAAAVLDIQTLTEPIFDAAGDLHSALTHLQDNGKKLQAWVDRARNATAEAVQQGKTSKPSLVPHVPARAAAAPEGLPIDWNDQIPVSGLTKAQTKILGSLEWWRSLGHARPTRVQVAVKAGMKHSGGGFRARLSELAGKGLIEYPDAKTLAMSDLGRVTAPRQPMGGTIVSTIRPLLTQAQAKIFDAMRQGHTMRADIAAACDPPMEASGGGFRARLSELSSFGILEYPDSKSAKLADWVNR